MNKYQKKSYEVFSILTPWETEPEETSIDKYCIDFISQHQNHQNTTNLPKIYKKRAVSTCATAKKQQHFTPGQRRSAVNTHHDVLTEFTHKNISSISAFKNDRTDRKKSDRGNVLQEISVKNFIIEGGQQPDSVYKQKVLKKRESSYVLKHKFAEFRRSVKLTQNKENANFKVVRYALD